MLSLYYKIWVDAIVFEQTKNGSRRNWKLYTLIPISMFQGINMVTLCVLVSSVLNIKIDLFLNINVFGSQFLNTLCSSLLTLLAPFLVLNYFLIFYRTRYLKIIERYKYQNGKLYLSYFLFTMGVILLPIIIIKWVL
jgi:hypothetical protein